MDRGANRRTALMAIGIAAGTAAIGTTAIGGADAAEMPPGSDLLMGLTTALSRAPRPRDFKTVPMILNDRAQWDADALDLLFAYRGTRKQVWDHTAIEGPWLNLMRNALNAQIWSFRHPDFLVVSATHGSAHLALFDQPMWAKYRLADLTNGKMTSNTLIDGPSNAEGGDYQDPGGPYSAAGNSIPALMQRGVVFVGCHNAIWEIAAKLIKSGVNPDQLLQPALAAELTNHLIPGVVLSPGVVATIPELQHAGFSYIA